MTRRRRLGAAGTAVLLAVLLLAGVAARTAGPLPSAAAAGPGAGQPGAGPASVVVVGVAGLRWSDVGAHTPHLQRLAATGAVGVLSVKALPDVTCAGDGWLTLGAGARAEAFGVGGDRCGPGLPADLAAEARRNAASRDGARLGALAAALGGAVTAAGAGARAALGATSASEPPGAARLRLVDAGQVGRASRAGDLARLDGVLGRELARRPPGGDLLLVGLAEGPGEATARLHVAAATGPSFPAGALRSASTRRAPYVQLVDVAPTVLALLGAPVPEVMDGQPWRVTGAVPSAAALADLDDRAVTAKRVTVPFYVVLVAALLGLLLALRRRPGAAALVARAGTAALGASYVAQLVPWWRSPAPLLALVAVVAVLSLTTALLVRPVGALCGLTAAVLAGDLLAGAPLQMDAVAGYSPLVAGRFAGLGNVAFGVYGTACLLCAASLAGARSRGRAAVVAALGVPAVVVAGAPPWGSDVGGVLALVPAFAVLALLLTGSRVSAARLLLAAAAGAALVTGFALLDLARPAQDRSHLGRFAADLRDGTAGDLLLRKAQAVLGLLLSSPVTALLPVLVAAAVWLMLRPPPALRAALDAVPALRHALTAVGVLSAVGFLVNDSGAAVPAMALLLAAPATTAVVAARAALPAGKGTPVA